jgi:mannose-6-phosphate isomerase-like protein (cupin superfamily)
MTYKYPHIIENGGGEKLTFINHFKDEEGDYLEIENLVQPNAGPPMHVHYKQEEKILVLKGKMGVQVMCEEPQYFGEGETVTFPPGQAHKFWNAGSEPLYGKGWVRPANNVEYFLTEIFASTKANGGKRPGNFDAAYLTTRYKSEFAMVDIPSFVKTFMFPLIIFLGKLQGKHKKFKDAPKPL